MKKCLALLCAAIASGSLFAETTHFAQTFSWSIRNAGAMWYVPNGSGTVNISFTVNNTLASRPSIHSDKVNFLCDKMYEVKPGQTIHCRMTSHVRAEFQVTGGHYKNGAEGSYTVS